MIKPVSGWPAAEGWMDLQQPASISFAGPRGYCRAEPAPALAKHTVAPAGLRRVCCLQTERVRSSSAQSPPFPIASSL